MSEEARVFSYITQYELGSGFRIGAGAGFRLVLPCLQYITTNGTHERTFCDELDVPVFLRLGFGKDIYKDPWAFTTQTPLRLPFSRVITPANSSKVHFKVSFWHFGIGSLVLWTYNKRWVLREAFGSKMVIAFRDTNLNSIKDI